MGTLLNPYIIPCRKAYTPISKLGHDDLLNSLSVMPIVSSIDLFSSLVEILIYFTTFGPESTPFHGNSIPLPPATAVRVDGNFHGFGGYLCSWRIYVLDTPP